MPQNYNGNEIWKKQIRLITTAALILDRSDSARLSPVNGFRQGVTVSKSVAIALGGGQAARGTWPSAEIHFLILQIGQIGEAIEAELEGPAGGGVLLLYVPEILLKNLEALLLLAEGIVGLAVLDDPRLVHGQQVVVDARETVLLVVGDDGHVGGPWVGEEEREEEEERERKQGVCSHG